jgi:D-hexose-6-phosphate mutarotase
MTTFEEATQQSGFWNVSQGLGEGDLPKICCASTDGKHSVEVYLFGATLTSWKCDYKERIFLSQNALFNGVKAIRGGIPICFPQFSKFSTFYIVLIYLLYLIVDIV